MGILGINNRTENWKTAKTFSRFFDDPGLRLKLARRLGEPSPTEPEQVQLELFWKGMRDYFHTNGDSKPTDGKLAKKYADLFPDLRSEIKGFGSEDGLTFEQLKPGNYEPSEPAALRDNLIGMEIDIVLDTPDRLYIGEAKDESGFHASGRLVLVHQLVRQYVMASILVKLSHAKKEVVPFIVWNGLKQRQPAQIQFMLKQCWLKNENILTWDEVEKLSA